MKVKITKIQGVPNSSIEVGYWVKGTGHNPIIGKSLWIEPVDATMKSDRFDFFHTTNVLSFDGEVITTQNSKWRFEKL